MFLLCDVVVGVFDGLWQIELPSSGVQAGWRISSHLISSHLISPHSSHLISSHLISSHLISSHLISSHLIEEESKGSMLKTRDCRVLAGWLDAPHWSQRGRPQQESCCSRGRFMIGLRSRRQEVQEDFDGGRTSTFGPELRYMLEGRK